MQIKNILIVDDDAEDSEFFTTVVQQINPVIQVTMAANKGELFQCLQQGQPDIVFIDSFLQQDSGHQSISEIKAHPHFTHLPIIMYTGAADAKSIASAFDVGASAYIVKPHSLQEIKTVLETILATNWDSAVSPQKQYYLNREFHSFNP